MSTVAEIAELAHGYSMARVDDIAKYSVRSYPRSLAVLGYEDRYDTAYLAVVEHLYSVQEVPDWRDLRNAAHDALRDACGAWYQSHGVNDMTMEQRPSFHQYWLPVVAGLSDFTDRVAERLALPQVLATLTPAHYEALAALAVHGSNTAAAAAIGIKPAVFNNRIQKARQAAIAAWFDHEQPPKKPDRATACKQGHLWSEHGVENPDGTKRCRLCCRERSRNTRRRSYAREKAAREFGELLSPPAAQ
jgi:DNA-directed RNA polymerase specialized sigma24 family protein